MAALCRLFRSVRRAHFDPRQNRNRRSQFESCNRDQNLCRTRDGMAYGFRYARAERHRSDFKKELDVFNSVRTRYRRIVALLLPRATDGRGIEGRSRRQNERRDYDRPRLCFSARKGFGKIDRRCASPYGGYACHGIVTEKTIA